MLKSESRTENLVAWATQLRYDDLPRPVVERTKELFLDWLACTMAGRHHPAISAIGTFVQEMGPAGGRSEIIHDPDRSTSPAFAALLNGACSHVVEQDDLHNSSMMHPATVVFPTALAVAQEVGADGRSFLTACIVGYDVACRAGEYLGESHYRKFHTTATAGVVGAAATAAYLLRLDPKQMLSAIGTAGTQAAGLWQFLLDASHSKQVHTGKACFDGIFAAYTAYFGLLGPHEILEGKSGMSFAMVPGQARPTALDDRLGVKYSIMESSFKWHAACRHTHPSVDALLTVMKRHNLGFDDVETVVSHTYRAAIDILSQGDKAETVHQSKFSMGFVLAVAAKNGRASVTDFTEDALKDPALRAFQKRVTMQYDPDIDAAFPKEWQGLVEVTTKSGEKFSERVEVVKGDPGSPLTRNTKYGQLLMGPNSEDLKSKAILLSKYGKVTDTEAVHKTIERVWQLEGEQDVRGFACS
ncbi:hypothetical protein N7474_007976 [Penicillium riverlandense]|uniref:uncharacterized protein n=1 Tax=Penicillium riverlandense TaxID=1903569 RepID=UPI0025497A0E|nr:uncharacterized protein N7474_007976 [Penicillium riverlandense]KAJ5811675.1 hypothetical protein N7474_007976 [Penicillium riverlandense]